MVKESLNRFDYRRKPSVIQLPITSRCNSRCQTCNIWKHRNWHDIDPCNLKKVLNSSYFSEVTSVGVNGGEPSLHPSFLEVIKSLTILPKLKNIYVISNCIGSTKLLSLLEDAHKICKSNNISLNLQISIDGVKEVHNLVRGVNVSFERSIYVLNTLLSSKSRYVDNFDIGCTISKSNVDFLAEFEDFFSSYDVKVYYHLAVPNKRIGNFYDADFSVLNDEHTRQMAAEFFYARWIKSTERQEKIRNYLIYLYLVKRTTKRMFLCDFLLQDITINERLDTFLCATASEKVGNLLEISPTKKIYNRLTAQTRENCDSCIHYANTPNLRGIITYYLDMLKLWRWISRYKYSI